MGGAPNVDPLGETYYSVTPFRYGDYIAKFAVVPVSDDLTSITKKEIDATDRPDAIRQRARKEPYEHSAEYRARFNRCPIHEPSGAEA